MAQLRREIKLYIVRSLAVFNTPTEVIKAVKEEFGVEVSIAKCMLYDPTKRTGKELGKELKEEFHKTREGFLAKPLDIPISNQAYRLAELQKIYDNNPRNPKLRQSLIEQAAKELGGAFTNKREVTGKDGAPLPTSSTVVNLTPEAAKEAARVLKDEY